MILTIIAFYRKVVILGRIDASPEPSKFFSDFTEFATRLLAAKSIPVSNRSTLVPSEDVAVVIMPEDRPPCTHNLTEPVYLFSQSFVRYPI